MRIPCVVVALAVAALLAGCGTRESAAEVLAANGGAAVTIQLPPGVLPAPAPAAASPVAAGIPVSTKASAGSAPITAPTKHAAVTAAAVAPAAGTAPVAPVAQPTAKSCPAGALPLRLGQVGHFSGVVGPLTQGARTGLAVWARDVNARGGINCHPVQLYQLDDGADPSRTAAAIADLVTNKHVAAMVASFSPLAPAAVREAAEKYKLPVIGGDLAAFEWNQSPYLFPQGASLLTRAWMVMREAVEAGLPKMGILYCVETPSCTTLDKLLEGQGVAKKAGIDVVYSSPVSIASTDYTAQCQNAKNAGAQTLGVAMDGASINRLVRSCAALNFHPPIVTDSLLISTEQAADPQLRHNTVLSSNITAPWMLTDTPGLRAYHDAMGRYAPGYVLDSSSILAWTSGKLAEAAIDKLPMSAAVPTSAQIVGSLGQMHGERLDGLAAGITFRAGQPAPEGRCLYYTRLDERGWSAPKGSKPVCY